MDSGEDGSQPGQLQASLRTTSSSHITVTATTGELGKNIVAAMTQMFSKSSQRVITGTDGLEVIRYARDAFNQVFTAVEPAMGRLQTLEVECKAQEEEIDSLRATISARDITIRTLEKELEESRGHETQALPKNLLTEANQALASKDQATNTIQKGWDDEKAFRKLEQQKAEQLKKKMENFRAAHKTREEKEATAKAELLEQLDKQKKERRRRVEFQATADDQFDKRKALYSDLMAAQEELRKLYEKFDAGRPSEITTTDEEGEEEETEEEEEATSANPGKKDPDSGPEDVADGSSAPAPTPETGPAAMEISHTSPSKGVTPASRGKTPSPTDAEMVTVDQRELDQILGRARAELKCL
ncbi:hypothetical protein R1sor_003183 [Riccia sorocarpa]|uniref:Uncharacterized protein n=1 Tax=Riccia sorocarpa TaxID=122646 RepID=A0ABD3H2J1_9MARC